jgi:prepilin-type processing-associated H-X9-DG protein
MRVSRQKQAGRVRAELIIVAVIMLVFVGILVPVIQRTHRTALIVRCRQQLMRVFSALQQYTISHGGVMPAHDARGSGGPDWRRTLEEFADPEQGRSDTLWECPAGGPYLGNVHVFSARPRPVSEYRLRRQIGLVSDGKASYRRRGVSDSRGIDWRHREGANVLFIDGHIEWAREEARAAVDRHWDKPQ